MRFKFDNYCFLSVDLKYWQELIGGTIENNNLYIEVENISELKDILDKIPEDLYDDTCGWKPKELHIDFEYNIIYLYDQYCE